MSYHVPFTEETYLPHSIAGNRDAADPVRFSLSAAGGPDLARLKSILFASGGVALENSWNDELQKAVSAAFQHGAELFVNTVDKIEGLTVPVALALKAGLLVEREGTPRLDRSAKVQVDTGAKFARVCGWMTVLAFEIAMEISKLSKEVDADTRFFGSSTISPKTPTGRNGSAEPVRRQRGARGIAAVSKAESGGATSGR